MLLRLKHPKVAVPAAAVQKNQLHHLTMHHHRQSRLQVHLLIPPLKPQVCHQLNSKVPHQLQLHHQKVPQQHRLHQSQQKQHHLLHQVKPLTLNSSQYNPLFNLQSQLLQ